MAAKERKEKSRFGLVLQNIEYSIARKTTKAIEFLVSIAFWKLSFYYRTRRAPQNLEA